MRTSISVSIRAALASILSLALLIVAAPGAAHAQEGITDADIAAIVVAANQADIDNGELAVEKASDERVKAFGRQMIEAHTAVNEAAGELVSELGVTPTPNDVSRSIAEGQAAARERLDDLDGAEFDREYIANEVAYHEAVIEAVDSTLIPSAQNAQLKQTLKDVRPSFVAHLEQARSIQEELEGN